MRVTSNYLERQVSFLNTVLGRSEQMFTDGKPNVDRVVLNSNSAGYSLAVIINDLGGERHIFGAVTASVMNTYIDGILAGIALQIAKSNSP